MKWGREGGIGFESRLTICHGLGNGGRRALPF